MKKINYLDSVIQPIITEKATSLSEQNKIVFENPQKAEEAGYTLASGCGS